MPKTDWALTVYIYVDLIANVIYVCVQMSCKGKVFTESLNISIWEQISSDAYSKRMIKLFVVLCHF